MRGERLEVSVSFDERRGYVGTAPELRQPVTRQDAKPIFDARPTYDAIEGERRKREAYQQMVRDMQTRGI